MLYPDVFTGKKPKCSRKGKCFGTGNADQSDSIESGTYLCDPQDGKSPYTDVKPNTNSGSSWNRAMSAVMKRRYVARRNPVLL